METVPVAIGALGVITKKHREAHKQDYRKGTFTPSLCQCSILRVFKATATQIREKSEQTLESLRIELGTSSTEGSALTNCAKILPTLQNYQKLPTLQNSCYWIGVACIKPLLRLQSYIICSLDSKKYESNHDYFEAYALIVKAGQPICQKGN